MKLILIRHAESVRNVVRKGKTFYDVGEQKIGLPNYLIPITKKGEGQAKDAAKNLYNSWRTKKHTPPVVILHSGYVRTRDTANIIHTCLKKHAMADGIRTQMPLEQNHLLRERDAGHAFEMNCAEAKQHFPHLEDYWKLDGKWFAVPPGGESIVQVMDRVSLFLSQLVHDSRMHGNTVYAATHGGTMMAFQMVIEKIPFDEAGSRVQGPKNCEIIEYEYKDGVWRSAS